MTLTEEQRGTAAFDLEKARAVDIDLLAATDWGELRARYRAALAEIERLRAMIDSSEHFTDASKMIGFDLEKARAADEVLPYPLDAKEIWISRKGQMHINPPNTPSIFFTLSDLCEFRNIFHGQAAEIERLLGEKAFPEKVVHIKNTRLKELEDELVKERTGAIRCESYNHCEGMYEIDLPNAIIRAQTELRAEGKIGPDAGAKPQVWQITEGRVGLLEYCLESLLDAPDIDDYSEPRQSIRMLRAMLTEAGQ